MTDPEHRRERINLSLKQSDKDQLQELAAAFGFTWGDRPNISKLMEAIARRKVLLTKNNDWSQEQIRALNQARTLLVDAGSLQEALALAQILLERSELTIPLRQELSTFVESLTQSWRQQLDTLIQRQQPFCLSYQDASGHLWQFHIHHARIVLHERRHYLDCWCDQTEGSDEIFDLIHNRSLRLDRITDAVLLPLSGTWKSALDSLTVILHLYPPLAFAYTPRPQDLEDSWIHGGKIRQIQREITSSFWFFREVLPYAEACEIIGPPEIRSRFCDHLQAMMNRYR